MEEIKNLEEAKEHLNKLLALLKKNPIQEETKKCILTLEKESLFYFYTNTFEHRSFNILRRRAKIQTLKIEPFVTGFEVLFSNVGGCIIKDYRESNIWTEIGLFMIHTNDDYTTLFGVLESKRTLEDLRKSGLLKEQDKSEKMDFGWKIE